MNEYLVAAHSTCKSPSPRKEEYLEKRHLIYQEKATNIEDASSAFPFTYKIDKEKDSTALKNPFPKRPTIHFPKFSPLHNTNIIKSPPLCRQQYIPRPSQPVHQPTDPLIQIFERQNKLTEILSHQHQQSLLPPLGLSILKGDPTEYHIFIHTFET